MKKKEKKFDYFEISEAKEVSEKDYKLLKKIMEADKRKSTISKLIEKRRQENEK